MGIGVNYLPPYQVPAYLPTYRICHVILALVCEGFYALPHCGDLCVRSRQIWGGKGGMAICKLTHTCA